MVFLIGFLRLPAFFTGFLFLSNAVRAYDDARTRLPAPVLAALALVGSLMELRPAGAAPWAGEQTVSRRIDNPDSDAALS
jgi:hypothetical protein